MSNIYSGVNEGMETFFNNKDEELFLASLLKKEMRVLEWGSGLSTIFIAKRVESVLSVEHLPNWFEEIKPQLPINAEIILREPLDHDYSGDGSLINFFSYINAPNSFLPFDLIFIDGRARMECAKIAPQFLKENGTIVIHDIFHPVHKWKRYEYDQCLEWLEHTGGVFTMHSFTPKKK